MGGERLSERFWSKVRKGAPGECWPWTGAINSRQYGQLWDGGVARKAHRISWELHNGPIAPSLFVCHRCDNPICVNPAHLFLGTAADNNADMHRKGRHHPPRGHAHIHAKLSEVDAIAIYSSRNRGATELAREYRVTRDAIYKIWCGVTWRHATGAARVRGVSRVA